MGQVLPFCPSVEELDAAWERHAALARATMVNPRLLLNRAHMQEVAQAERAFKNLYLRHSVVSAPDGGG
jgi:hypothetical protein